MFQEVWKTAFAAGLAAMMITPAWSADYSSEVKLQINRVYTNTDSYFSTGRPTVIVTLTNRSAYPLSSELHGVRAHQCEQSLLCRNLSSDRYISPG